MEQFGGVAERAKKSFYDDNGHVVASLDKTPCNDYLCLVASNTQQIQWTKFEEIHRNVGSL